MSKKAKQIAAGFGIAAAAGLGVSAVRAATTFKPDKVDESQQLAPEKVDLQRYIDHLPTVSYRDVEKVDWAQFDAFHAFLKEAYPLIHEKLDLQIISRKSLMYHWASEHPEREPIAMLAHQDVVPISEGTEGDWDHPPFSGEVADGFIWGRGALDIKNHLIGVMDAVETLVEEGYVNELVSKIQTMRKDSGFEVTDRIDVTLTGNDKLYAVADKNRDAIATVVLAESITAGGAADHAKEWDINGERVTIGVSVRK